ncbi:MAG: FtsQ-type POTRA domain-containing protein [Treponema sp.]|nr:FtsQ-type POTRA domain-containing protein [Treponema sp.]
MNDAETVVEPVSIDRFESAQKDEGGEKKIKIVKAIFGILCFFLVAELVIYKYVMPAFSSPKVTVSGQNRYSAEEIAEKLLPMNSTNWANFNVSEAVAILSSEPGIDNVMVEKKFPDRIYINVVEREPVALTFIVDDGYTNPVQIDRNGVLFPVKDNDEVNSNLIPIISGLPVEHMSGGMRIPSKYRPLIDQIYKISSLGNNYFAGISEICVLPKDTGNYELALIPSQSKIKVLTDRSLNEDALKYMMVVLDVVNKIGADVSEIDLRYGSVSCKIR